MIEINAKMGVEIESLEINMGRAFGIKRAKVKLRLHPLSHQMTNAPLWAIDFDLSDEVIQGLDKNIRDVIDGLVTLSTYTDEPDDD